MADDSPDLLVDIDGPVMTVTLNRPEARNAFSPDMLVRAADAWKQLDEDPALRVGILTGAEGCFCSGMDLKALANGMGDETAAGGRRGAQESPDHGRGDGQGGNRDGRAHTQRVEAAAEGRRPVPADAPGRGARPPAAVPTLHRQ